MDVMEKTRAACDQLLAVHLPRWNELPDIELYMDQVLALMAKYMQGVASGEDKVLTASMVNNYVKMGLVPAPVKKKYSRSHLARLVIICVMKQVVPMAIIRGFIETGLEDFSEQQLLDMAVEYYDHAAAAAAERAMERAEVRKNEGAGVALLAAAAAIRSQIELSLSEKLSAVD
ncbi:MAG: DUF1836 domain-containing protein [Oscillospiraceae bacterium]|nr:DUF1836 domain-containing protein [Oscillospiraceae bacterium]